MSMYEEILERMEEAYRQKSGCNIDDASDIGIRLKLVARELGDFGEEIKRLERELFPQSATGSYLTLHANQRGLERKKGSSSYGEIIFKRDTPAQRDIIIPKGTIATSGIDSGLEFETASEGVIRQGETSTRVRAYCTALGKRGNCSENAVCSLVSPISGVMGIESTRFCGGEDEESDEELRKRLLRLYRSIPNGTNEGFYQKLALETPGISFAKVFPRKNGIGTVHLALLGKDKSMPLSKEIIDSFLSRANEQREINVDVTAEQAVVREQNVSLELFIDESEDAQKERSLAIDRVRKYLNELGIGEAVYASRLLKEAMRSNAIINARLIEPSEDVRVLPSEIVAPGIISARDMVVI